MLSIANESDFNVDNGLYAVKFWATWCQPCKIFARTVSSLDEEFESVDFLSIDCEMSDFLIITKCINFEKYDITCLCYEETFMNEGEKLSVHNFLTNVKNYEYIISSANGRNRFYIKKGFI